MKTLTAWEELQEIRKRFRVIRYKNYELTFQKHERTWWCCARAPDGREFSHLVRETSLARAVGHVKFLIRENLLE